MKIIITCSCLLLSCLACAQEPAARRLQWGFFTGLTTQSLGIEPLDGKEPDEASVQSARPGVGFTAGFMLEKNIWHGFGFEPGLAFSWIENEVRFRPEGASIYPFSDIELPLHFTLTNQNKQLLPLHAKLRFGPRLGWNIARAPESGLNLYRRRVGLDLGLGVEIKWGKWKFCPEMLYSHGMNNLHDFRGSAVDFLTGRIVRDKLALRVVFKK